MVLYRLRRGLLTSVALLGTAGPVEFPAGSGASGLLEGELDGFSIDATTVGNATYVGGPDGGTVSVGEDGVFSDDNVALDSSILTQSGTSPKRVHWNEAPFVRWTPHNLSPSSNVYLPAPSGNWLDPANVTVTGGQADPGGGTLASSVIETTDNGQHKVGTFGGTTTAVSAARPMTISCFVKNLSGTRHISLYIAEGTFTNSIEGIFDPVDGSLTTSNVTGTSTIVDSGFDDVGSGWFRVWISGIVDTASSAVYPYISMFTSGGSGSYAGDGTSGFYIFGFQTNRGEYPTPYVATPSTSAASFGIPQAYDPYEDCFGILPEPATTNLQLRSEEFDNAQWTAQNVTVGANAVTAPDGATTADSLTASAGSAVHNLYSGDHAGTTGVTTTSSVYVKDSTARYVQLSRADAATTWIACAFDLQSGIVGTAATGAGGSSVAGATITAIGNGWYRLTITGTIPAATSNMVVAIASGINPTRGNFGDETWNAAGTEVLYFWGAQTELGPLATTYIPTLSSTVTRASDAVIALVADVPAYSALKGTVFADWKAYENDNDVYPVNLDDTTTNEWLPSYGPYAGDDRFYFEPTDGGVSQASLALDGMTYDTRHDATWSWAANDFDASYDGGAVSSDASGTIPTVTRFVFCSVENGGNGMLYRMVYVPRQVQTEG
jgi:hypothetical protein